MNSENAVVLVMQDDPRHRAVLWYAAGASRAGSSAAAPGEIGYAGRESATLEAGMLKDETLRMAGILRISMR